MKEHFNKKNEMIFKEIISDKLTPDNFEYYYYHKSCEFHFNRGFVRGDNEWLISLEISNGNQNQILAYTNSTDSNFLDNIFDFIDVKSPFQGIMGSYAIVNHILNKYPSNFEIFMDRIFYELKKNDFKENIINDCLIIEKATLPYFEEIARMMVDFSILEWKEKNTKEYSDCLTEVSKLCENIGIIKYSNNEIVGYAFIDRDMIGTIYIKEEHRRKMFGQIVLSKITKMLLSNSSKVKVMTTNENIPMRKILEKVGYKEHCKHLEVWKKNI